MISSSNTNPISKSIDIKRLTSMPFEEHWVKVYMSFTNRCDHYPQIHVVSRNLHFTRGGIFRVEIPLICNVLIIICIGQESQQNTIPITLVLTHVQFTHWGFGKFICYQATVVIRNNSLHLNLILRLGIGNWMLQF